MNEIIKLSFECGEGRHFSAGVNYLVGEGVSVSIYAEVQVPDGASDDYGYLAMKEAILREIAENGVSVKIDFPYDGKEQYLAPDASEGEDDVYTDVYEEA